MLLTKVFFALLLTMCSNLEVSAQEDFEEEECPFGWTWNLENNFCYFVSEHYAGFNVAERSCRRMSSAIASVVSFEEYFFILPLLFVHRQKCSYNEDCLNYWIGLRSVAGGSGSPQKWTWTDGSPYSAQNSMWGPAQPGGIFNCGSIRAVDKGSELIGYWREANCDRPMKYICKKLPSPV